MTTEQEISRQVEQRAEELLPGDEYIPLDGKFVKSCLDANERGDGVLFSTLHQGLFLYNTTPKDGQWYYWDNHVWATDDFKKRYDGVEKCAVEHLVCAEDLEYQIGAEGIEDKKEKDGWKIVVRDQHISRAKKLRSETGVEKTLKFAPVVDRSMACSANDFDCQPWLLAVKNGVIDLKTGALVDGTPGDMLTKCLDIEYDPRADYEPFLQFIKEISVNPDVPGTEEIPAFLKRIFGYAATGHSHEQYIFVFLGPGRNGKGVLFNLIADVMGPFYHEISQAMILEQRNEPSANAASEHKYSLMGKRLVVGAETNKNKKIDASAVKSLSGQNKIVARPNFGKEVVFAPSHTLFLQTNNLPYGLTSEFSLVQRLVLIDLPYMYVDDIKSEQKRFPGQAGKFRQKDKDLETKLLKFRQGILRWIVEGCRDWQKDGLSPPDCILTAVNELAKEEDYINQFVTDCLEHLPDKDDLRLSCKSMYRAFRWWWSENMDPKEKRVPALKTINKALRERGFKLDKVGGLTYVFQLAINYKIALEVDAYINGGDGKS